MSDPSIPGWVLGRVVGRGADATVYAAHADGDATEVAMKIVPLRNLIDPAQHLRQSWEAGATGSRQIVPILDTGVAGDVAWIAMELAAGDAAMLAAQRGGRLPCTTAVTIAIEVARGLAVLADHGFIHRDIKPSNILLRRDGSAMIGDLAPLRGGGTASRSADLRGTPAYLSPEQVRGRHPDIRSDIHALAATLFTLLAGRPPYVADNTLELLQRIAEDPVPDIATLRPDVPPAIAAALARGLAKNPDDRPQRPAAFAASLEAALQGRIPAPAPPAPVTAPPPRQHSWLIGNLIPVTGVFATLCGLGIGFLASSHLGVPAPPSMAAIEGQARAFRDREQVADETELLRLRQRLADAQRERSWRLEPARKVAPPVAAAPALPQDPPPQPVPTSGAPLAAASPATLPPQPAPGPAITPAPATLGQTPVQPTSQRRDSTIDSPESEPAPQKQRARFLATNFPRGMEYLGINPRTLNHLVLWDDYQTLLVSTDGGGSWKENHVWQTRPSGERAPIGPLAIWHGRSGFIPGNTKFSGWVSRDEGATWRSLGMPVSVMSLAPAEYAMQRTMLRDGSIWAASPLYGQSSAWRLMRTVDDGTTWRDQFDLTASKLVLYPAANYPLLVVSDSGVWRGSGDLGKTWQDIPSGSHEKGVACQAGGVLGLLSWRGGMTWFDASSGAWTNSPLQQRQKDDLAAIAVDPRDRSIAFSLDRKLGLLRTTDAGRTWLTYRHAWAREPSALAVVGLKSPQLYVLAQHQLLVLDLTQNQDDMFYKEP